MAERGGSFRFTAAFPVVALGVLTPTLNKPRWRLPGRGPASIRWSSISILGNPPARGEIMIAARDGHSVPHGTGIDSNGKDTTVTDPRAILDGGAQLAFGGYEQALAMMVELLVWLRLSGDSLSF